MTTSFDRRKFLQRGAAVTAGTLLVGGGTQALAATAPSPPPVAAARRFEAPNNGGYGPIGPGGGPHHRPAAAVPAGRLRVRLVRPRGVLRRGPGRRAADDIGSDGYPTPGRHDGMATFADRRPRTSSGWSATTSRVTPRSTRRPAATTQTLIGDPDNAYDERAAGGTTDADLRHADADADRQLHLAQRHLGQLRRRPDARGAHGCPARRPSTGTQNGFARTTATSSRCRRSGGAGDEPGAATRPWAGSRTRPSPIDPATDRLRDGGQRNTSGFYRFLPNEPGNLGAGGTLQMLAVKEQPAASTPTTGPATGWATRCPVDVGRRSPTPTRRHRITSATSVFKQGSARGRGRLRRLEGCWYDGGSSSSTPPAAVTPASARCGSTGPAAVPAAS